MYEYSIKEYSEDTIEQAMNKMAKAGWRVIAVNHLTCFNIMDPYRYAVTFERQVK